MNGKRKLVDFGLDCIRMNNFYKGPFLKVTNARKIPFAAPTWAW